MNSAPSLSRSAVRALALGAALKLVRARQGWSVETAASQAGMGHMTWRRAEDGHSVRAATYNAMEQLLTVPFGAIRQALGSDERMVDLLGRLNIGFIPTAAPAAEQVGSFAMAVLDQESVKPAIRARLSTLGIRDALRGNGGAVSVNLRPARADTDFGLATGLIERIARRPHSAKLDAAVDALLDALPELVDRQQEPQ